MVEDRAFRGAIDIGSCNYTLQDMIDGGVIEEVRDLIQCATDIHHELTAGDIYKVINGSWPSWYTDSKDREIEYEEMDTSFNVTFLEKTITWDRRTVVVTAPNEEIAVLMARDGQEDDDLGTEPDSGGAVETEEQYFDSANVDVEEV